MRPTWHDDAVLARMSDEELIKALEEKGQSARDKLNLNSGDGRLKNAFRAS